MPTTPSSRLTGMHRRGGVPEISRRCSPAGASRWRRVLSVVETERRPQVQKLSSGAADLRFRLEKEKVCPRSERGPR